MFFFFKTTSDNVFKFDSLLTPSSVLFVSRLLMQHQFEDVNMINGTRITRKINQIRSTYVELVILAHLQIELVIFNL